MIVVVSGCDAMKTLSVVSFLAATSVSGPATRDPEDPIKEYH